MFMDKSSHEFGDYGFVSSWRKTLSVNENEAQTEPLTYQDQEIQARIYADCEAQTMDPPRSTTKDPDNQINSPSLVKFLNDVTPMIEKELEATLRSRAFEGYSLLEEEIDSQVRKVHILSSQKIEDDGKIRISSVSWNSSGTTVAAAYEVTEHDQWCSHDSVINAWNISKRSFDPGNPNHQINVASCITDLQFHPNDPSYLLSATYTGELSIWSVNSGFSSDEDPFVASTIMQGHEEKVSSAQWIVPDGIDSLFRNTRILSSSLDGNLILWKIDLSEQSLIPLVGYTIQPEHLPKSLKIRARSSTEIGITCFSLNNEDKDILLIGTEAGVVFQGSLSSEAPGRSREGNLFDENLEWKDPVVMAFGPFKRGRIIDIKCSPFHRDIFASLASDQEIRIYSLLTPHTPVIVLHSSNVTLTQLDWSPIRPLVLAAASQSSSIQIYDLRITKSDSSLSLKATEKSINFPITTMRFNKKNRTLIAAGDGLANIHIWKLTGEFTSANATEIMDLYTIANTVIEE